MIAYIFENYDILESPKPKEAVKDLCMPGVKGAEWDGSQRAKGLVDSETTLSDTIPVNKVFIHLNHRM